MTDRERVESYIPMVKFIAAICGPRCEVVLHCLDDLEHSIIAIENGHVTGRHIGGELMDYALDTMINKEFENMDFIANYPGRPTVDNKVLRFSTYYIRREEDHKIIGLLNVNMDITPFVKVKEIMDAELFMTQDSVTPTPNAGLNPLALSAGTLVDSIFQHAMNQIGCVNPENMQKEDKMKVIAIFNERNLFTLKGVIGLTAKKLHMSEPSVYRYLKELKESQE